MAWCLQEGATVGYDRIARLHRDSRVADVSIGYANGVRRISPQFDKTQQAG